MEAKEFELLILEFLRKIIKTRKFPFGTKFTGSKPKYASGKLYNSVFVNGVKFNDDLTEMTFNFEATPEVIDYLEVIDKGRRPGATPPPIKKILAWMAIRGIAIRDDKGRFKKETNKRLSLGYAIARGISKNGIRPTNIIKITEAEIKREIMNNIEFFELYEQYAYQKLTEILEKNKIEE